ncbi:Uncharacterised protein [Metamycoplasma cloacale]|uniref:Uncharacterized protein n=1 Tax=Metamycoplasma cloacale TaxID=92401 RepID=A0A2Z4LLP5_9BACT|nr:hypothetical protein [Metamycoplasma cloacale]AWX42635.1 hypothetical protein DK849_00865 [Metamycoplasma cloacale]VEU79590.1 Uncharacterised protein [Metamycoplasma cloacale]
MSLLSNKKKKATIALLTVATIASTSATGYYLLENYFLNDEDRYKKTLYDAIQKKIKEANLLLQNDKLTGYIPSDVKKHLEEVRNFVKTATTDEERKELEKKLYLITEALDNAKYQKELNDPNASLDALRIQLNKLIQSSREHEAIMVSPAKDYMANEIPNAQTILDSTEASKKDILDAILSLNKTNNSLNLLDKRIKELNTNTSLNEAQFNSAKTKLLETYNKQNKELQVYTSNVIIDDTNALNEKMDKLKSEINLTVGEEFKYAYPELQNEYNEVLNRIKTEFLDSSNSKGLDKDNVETMKAILELQRKRFALNGVSNISDLEKQINALPYLSTKVKETLIKDLHYTENLEEAINFVEEAKKLNKHTKLLEETILEAKNVKKSALFANASALEQEKLLSAIKYAETYKHAFENMPVFNFVDGNYELDIRIDRLQGMIDIIDPNSLASEKNRARTELESAKAKLAEYNANKYDGPEKVALIDQIAVLEELINRPNEFVTKEEIKSENQKLIEARDTFDIYAKDRDAHQKELEKLIADCLGIKNQIDPSLTDVIEKFSNEIDKAKDKRTSNLENIKNEIEALKAAKEEALSAKFAFEETERQKRVAVLQEEAKKILANANAELQTATHTSDIKDDLTDLAGNLDALIKKDPADLTEDEIKEAMKNTGNKTVELHQYEENQNARELLNEILQKVAEFKITTQDKNYDATAKKQRDALIIAQASAAAMLDNKYAKTESILQTCEDLKQVLFESKFSDKIFDAKQELSKIEAKVSELKEEKFDSTAKEELIAQRDAFKTLLNTPIDVKNKELVESHIQSLEASKTTNDEKIKNANTFVEQRSEKEAVLNHKVEDAKTLIKKMLAQNSPDMIASSNKLQQVLDRIEADSQKTLSEIEQYINDINAQYTESEAEYLKKLANDDAAARELGEKKITEANNKLIDLNDAKYDGVEKTKLAEEIAKLQAILDANDPKASTSQIIDATQQLNQKIKELNDYKKSYDAKQKELEAKIASAKEELAKMELLTPKDSPEYEEQKQALNDAIVAAEAAKNTPTLEGIQGVIDNITTATTDAEANYQKRYKQLLDEAKAKADVALNNGLLFNTLKFNDEKYDGEIKDAFNNADLALKTAKAGTDLDKIRDLTEKLVVAQTNAELHKAKVDAQETINKTPKILGDISDSKYNSTEKTNLEEKEAALNNAIANATTSSEILEAEKEYKKAVEAMKIKKAQIEGQETYNLGDTKYQTMADNQFNSPEKTELKAALDDLAVKIAGSNIDEIIAAQNRVKRALGDADGQIKKHEQKKQLLQDLINEATTFKDNMSLINTDKENFEAKLQAAINVLNSSDSIDEALDDALIKLQRDLDGAKRDDGLNKVIELAQNNAKPDLANLESAIQAASDPKYAGDAYNKAVEAQKALDEIIKRSEGVDKNSILPEIEQARKNAQLALNELNNYKQTYDAKNDELNTLIQNAQATIESIKNKPEFNEKRAALEAEVANALTKINQPNAGKIIEEIEILTNKHNEVTTAVKEQEDKLKSPEYIEAHNLASEILNQAKQLLVESWVTGNDYASEQKTQLIQALTEKKDKLQTVVDNVASSINDLKFNESVTKDAIDKLKAYKAYKETEVLLAKYTTIIQKAIQSQLYFNINEFETLKNEITKTEVLIQDKTKKYNEIEVIRKTFDNNAKQFDAMLNKKHSEVKTEATDFVATLTDNQFVAIKQELQTAIENNSDITNNDDATIIDKTKSILTSLNITKVKIPAIEVLTQAKRLLQQYNAAEYDSTQKTKLQATISKLEQKLATTNLSEITVAKDELSKDIVAMSTYATEHDKIKAELRVELQEALSFHNSMNEINNDKEAFKTAYDVANAKLNSTTPELTVARTALKEALATAKTENDKNILIAQSQSQAIAAFYAPANKWFTENISDAKYDSDAKTNLKQAIDALKTLCENKENINKDTFNADLKIATDKVNQALSDNLIQVASNYVLDYNTKNTKLKQEIDQTSKLIAQIEDFKTVPNVTINPDVETKLVELKNELTKAQGVVDHVNVNDILTTKYTDLVVKFTATESVFHTNYQTFYTNNLKPANQTVINNANDIAYKRMGNEMYDSTERTQLRQEVAQLIGVDLAIQSNINSKNYDVYILKQYIAKATETSHKTSLANGRRARIDATTPVVEAEALLGKMTNPIYNSAEKTQLTNELAILKEEISKEQDSDAVTAKIDEYIAKVNKTMEPTTITYNLLNASLVFKENIAKLKDSTYVSTNKFNMNYGTEMQKFYDFLFTKDKVQAMLKTANDETKSSFQRRIAKEMINVVLFTNRNFSTWGVKSVDDRTDKKELLTALNDLDDYLDRFYYVISIEEWKTGDWTSTARLRNFISGDKDFGWDSENYNNSRISVNGYRINRLQDSRWSESYGYQRYVLSVQYDANSAQGLYSYGYNGTMKTHGGSTTTDSLRRQSGNDMMKIWVNEGYIKFISNIYTLYDIIIQWANTGNNSQNARFIKLENDIDLIIKATGKPFVSLPVANALFRFIINNNIKTADQLFSQRPAYKSI